MPHGSTVWKPVDVEAAAAGIAAALEDQDTASAFRCVVQMLDDLGRVDPESGEALIQNEPDTTGDQRWDALLAGVVERACHRNSLPIPAWTTDPSRFLRRWWFFVPSPSLAASAFAEAPAALANRGVFLHASSLESV